MRPEITKRAIMLPDEIPNNGPIYRWFTENSGVPAKWIWRYACLLDGERYDAFWRSDTHQWMYLDWAGHPFGL